MIRRSMISASALAILIVSLIASSSSQDAQRIEITAKRFTYEPNEITVKKGLPVVLVVHSEDVTHGIKVPELGLQADIHKGKDTELNFTPAQTGTFQGQCSHFCGRGHGQMKLTIHVE
jgi:cytochrome c oxidase subunit II